LEVDAPYEPYVDFNLARGTPSKWRRRIGRMSDIGLVLYALPGADWAQQRFSEPVFAAGVWFSTKEHLYIQRDDRWRHLVEQMDFQLRPADDERVGLCVRLTTFAEISAAGSSVRNQGATLGKFTATALGDLMATDPWRHLPTRKRTAVRVRAR
jgi:hypothetical protein